MPTISGGGGKQFPKFKAIGDKVVGELVGWEKGVRGTFGPENVATLIGEDGSEIILRAGTNLTGIFDAHFDKLKGKVLTITFTKSIPSKKGNDCKLFTVDYPEDGDASFPPAANEPAGQTAEEVELERRLAEARARRAS